MRLPSQMTVILPLLRELFEEREIRSAQFVGFLSKFEFYVINKESPSFFK